MSLCHLYGVYQYQRWSQRDEGLLPTGLPSLVSISALAMHVDRGLNVLELSVTQTMSLITLHSHMIMLPIGLIRTLFCVTCLLSPALALSNKQQ